MRALAEENKGGLDWRQILWRVYNITIMKEVGKVTHYYGKIGVAIVDLSAGLKVGDKIKVEGNRTEFEQTVDSMEVEHAHVEAAKKGDVIGMKVRERVNEGATVYLLEE